MLRSALVLLAALAAVPSAALAKTFTLGSEPPVATITLPDSWNGEASDGAVEAFSPDDAIYLSAEIVDAEDLKAAGQELARLLEERKIELKADSRKVAAVTIAGMPGAAVSWNATDADGPTQVHMLAVKAKPGAEVLVLRWGNEAAEKDHLAELDAIVKSLASTK